MTQRMQFIPKSGFAAAYLLFLFKVNAAPALPDVELDLPVFEGDILGIDPEGMQASLSQNKTEVLMMNGLTDEGTRWTGGIVPYKISSNIRASDLVVILDAMIGIGEKTCVRFVKRTTEDDYIDIRSNSMGKCNSYVGRQGRSQILFLGADNNKTCIIKGIVQHELMHALGFWHEQSRTDRDKFVRINWNNIKTVEQHNFRRQDDTTVFGQPYDFGSVMHYKKLEFADNPSVWTIKPQPQYSYAEAQIGQRVGVSTFDIAKINRMYRCSTTPTRTTRTRTTATTTTMKTIITTATAYPVLYSGQQLLIDKYVRNAAVKLEFKANGKIIVSRTCDNHELWTTPWVASLGKSSAKKLVMQADGNLVLYGQNKDVYWASHTNGYPGAKLILQNDGFLCIAKDDECVWSNGHRFTPVYCDSPDSTLAMLGSSYEIDSHQYYRSSSGTAKFEIDTATGQLRIYRICDNLWTRKALLWDPNYEATNTEKLQMQEDGNLVLYMGDTKKTPYWASGTYGYHGAKLQFYDDGFLCIFYSGNCIWSTQEGIKDTRCTGSKSRLF